MGNRHEAGAVGLAGELTPDGHRLVARVYYADTDFSGFVYHARYLEFLERGRSDFLRLAGVHHTELHQGKHGERIVWVVRRMEIDFLSPARIDDILTVETRTERIAGARIQMAQILKRGDDVLALVRAGSPTLRLDVVVTTHRHADHLRALAPVVAATGASSAAGDPDAEAVSAATGVAVTRRLRHGDALRVGAVSLEVVALRGHTPGSVALAYREPDDVDEPEAVPGRVHLFTGDSLFPGGVGNTDRDPVRFEVLLSDVTTRVFDRFDDATWVYPGHGSDTTLGTERPHLDEWRDRGW